MARRRIIRPVHVSVITPADSRRLLKLRAELESARRLFQRWLARLKRAGNAVAKQQARIARLEKQLRLLEEC